MSKTAKILLTVAATIAVLILGSGLVLATTVVRAGMMTVRVQEPGKTVNLHIPAAVAYLGLDLLPLLDDLTDREREILGLIARHETNPEIANRLHLSQKTVRNHVSNIFTKLQVADRAQAIIRAREAGLGER